MTKQTLDYKDTLTVLGAIDALGALGEIIDAPPAQTNISHADKAKQFADDYIRAKKAFDENFEKAAKAQGVSYYVNVYEYDDELAVYVGDDEEHYTYKF
jgi:hypothetical protein